MANKTPRLVDGLSIFCEVLTMKSPRFMAKSPCFGSKPTMAQPRKRRRCSATEPRRISVGFLLLGLRAWYTLEKGRDLEDPWVTKDQPVVQTCGSMCVFHTLKSTCTFFMHLFVELVTWNKHTYHTTPYLAFCRSQIFITLLAAATADETATVSLFQNPENLRQLVVQVN